MDQILQKLSCYTRTPEKKKQRICVTNKRCKMKIVSLCRLALITYVLTQILDEKAGLRDCCLSIDADVGLCKIPEQRKTFLFVRGYQGRCTRIGETDYCHETYYTSYFDLYIPECQNAAQGTYCDSYNYNYKQRYNLCDWIDRNYDIYFNYYLSCSGTTFIANAQDLLYDPSKASDSSSFVIQDCEIYDTNCQSNAQLTNQVSMSSSSPWAITAKQSIQQDLQVCVKCTVKDDSSNHNTGKCQQQVMLKKVDCTINDFTGGQATPVNFEYTTNYLKQSLFATDTGLYGTLKCDLYSDAGAQTPYTGSFVSMQNYQSSRYLRFTPQASGHQESSIWLKCSNTIQTIITGELQFNQIQDCSSTISTISGHPTDILVTYDDTATLNADLNHGWQDFFVSADETQHTPIYSSYSSTLSNTNVAGCFINRCQITGLDSSFVNTIRISYTASENYKLYATWEAQRYTPGWEQYPLTFLCSADGVDYTVTNLKVKSPDLDPCATESVVQSLSPADHIVDFKTVTSYFDVTADVFTSSNPSLCPITNCVIYKYQSGACTNEVVSNSQNVEAIEESLQWKIKIKRNVSAGYTITTCLTCYMANGNSNTYSGTRNSGWQIKQISDCNSLVSSASAIQNPFVMQYNSLSSTNSIAQSFLDFFENIDNDCVYTSCEINWSGTCGTTSPIQQTDNISVVTTLPFNIIAQQNSEIGYSIYICYQCTTSGSPVAHAIFNQWQIKQVRNCATHIVAKSVTSKLIDYDASAATSDDLLTTYFDFIDENDCGLATCWLYAPGCSDSITTLGNSYDSYITLSSGLSSGSSGLIQYSQNVASGWGLVDICIKCTSTNGADQINILSVEQKMDCSTSLQVRSDAARELVLPYWGTTVEAAQVSSYLDIFDHLNIGKCPVITCEVYMANGIGTCDLTQIVSNTNPISMSATSPWSTNMLRNNVVGHNLHRCYGCNIGAHQFTHYLKFIQRRQCQDYLTTQSVKNTWTEQIAYDASTPTTVNDIDSSTKGFFNFKADLLINGLSSKECGVVTCSVKAQGCDTDLTESFGTHITITNPPGSLSENVKNTILITQNVQEGYNRPNLVPICIRCQTQHQDSLDITQGDIISSIDVDNLIVTQIPDCNYQEWITNTASTDIVGGVSVLSPAITSWIPYDFSSSVSTKAFGSSYSFLLTDNNDNGGVKLCNPTWPFMCEYMLYQGGACSGTYSESISLKNPRYLKKTANNWGLIADMNQNGFYKNKICLSCYYCKNNVNVVCDTSDQHLAVAVVFSATQHPNCANHILENAEHPTSIEVYYVDDDDDTPLYIDLGLDHFSQVADIGSGIGSAHSTLDLNGAPTNTDFFIWASDETTCGQVTCQILDQGCTTLTDSGNFLAEYLSILTTTSSDTDRPRRASKSYIQIDNTIDAGWSKTICISCSSTGQTNPVTIDRITISQRVNCNTLSVIQPSTLAASINYDISSSSILDYKDLTNDWNGIFANSKPIDCPVDRCEVMLTSATCRSTDPLCDGTTGLKTYTETSYLILSNDGRLQALQITTQGWTDTVNLWCKNSMHQAVLENYSITQKRDCSNVITQSTYADVLLQYSNSSPPQKYLPDFFFTNAYPTDCPIIECTIATESPTISDGMVIANGAISSTSTQAVQVLKNVVDGYSFTITLSCQNAATSGHQKITTNLWTITQVRDCSTSMSLNPSFSFLKEFSKSDFSPSLLLEAGAQGTVLSIFSTSNLDVCNTQCNNQNQCAKFFLGKGGYIGNCQLYDSGTTFAASNDFIAYAKLELSTQPRLLWEGGSNGSTQQLIIPSDNNDLQTCNTKCNSYSWCTNFSLGKGAQIGKCTLENTGATQVAGQAEILSYYEKYDTTNQPSLLGAGVCGGYSGSPLKRYLGIYTSEACNLICNQFYTCKNFQLGKGSYLGSCNLYPDGCTLDSSQTSWEFYAKSETYEGTYPILSSLGWQDIFLNSNNDPSPNGCEITSCQLWKAGQCGTGVLPQAISSILVIQSSQPWAISIYSYLPNGWQYSVCIQCQNLGNYGSSSPITIDHDNLFIQQKRDCSTMIGLEKTYESSYSTKIPYSTTQDAQVYKLFSLCYVDSDDPNTVACIGSPNPIFTLTDTQSDCERPTCQIRAAVTDVDCSSSSSALTMAPSKSSLQSSPTETTQIFYLSNEVPSPGSGTSSSTFDKYLYFKTSVLMGYQVDLCVYCQYANPSVSTSMQSVTYDHWSIQQVMDCSISVIAEQSASVMSYDITYSGINHAQYMWTGGCDSGTEAGTQINTLNLKECNDLCFTNSQCSVIMFSETTLLCEFRENSCQGENSNNKKLYVRSDKPKFLFEGDCSEIGTPGYEVIATSTTQTLVACNDLCKLQVECSYFLFKSNGDCQMHSKICTTDSSSYAKFYQKSTDIAWGYKELSSTAPVNTDSYPTGWKDFFTNLDNTNCPIDASTCFFENIVYSCGIGSTLGIGESCSYDSNTAVMFFVDAQNPTIKTRVIAAQDEQSGYDFEADIVCRWSQLSDSTVYNSPSVVIQPFKVVQTRDCSTHIVPFPASTFSTSIAVVPGDSSSNYLTFKYPSPTAFEFDHLDIFHVINPLICGSAQCTLHDWDSSQSACDFTQVLTQQLGPDWIFLPSYLTILNGKIIMKIDSAHGWEKSVCIKCQDVSGTASAVIENWKFQQPRDCSQALQPKPLVFGASYSISATNKVFPNKVILNYSEAIATKNILSSYEDWFEHHGPDECHIQDCKIYEMKDTDGVNDCDFSQIYDRRGQNNNVLIYQEGQDFYNIGNVWAYQNEAEGFGGSAIGHYVCYRCTVRSNEPIDYVYDIKNWDIQQVRDCSLNMKKLPNLPQNHMPFSYDTDSNVVFKSSQFFEFKDEFNCGMSQCELNLYDSKANACTTSPLDADTKQDQYMSIALKTKATSQTDASIFDITIQTGVEIGYGFDQYELKSNSLCLHCTSGDNSILFSNWTVTQVRDCNTALKQLTVLNSSFVNVTAESGVYETVKNFSYVEDQYELTNWASYFSNPDLEFCPIKNCQLLKPDCKEKLETINITMSETFPFTIKGFLNLDEGYNYSVCIECSVNDTKTTFGNYSIRQTRNCDTHLLKSTNQILAYQVLPLSQDDTNFKMSDIFEIAGEEFCGNVTCKLKQSGCSSDLTNDKISIEKSLDSYSINVKTDVQSGWGPEKICVECQSATKTIQFNDFTIIQQSNHQFGLEQVCKSSLSPKASIDPLQLIYDQSAVVFQQSSDLFENTDVVKCALRNCTLYEKDCTIILDSSSPVRLSSDKLVIIVVQNLIQGYDIQICAKCQNALQTVTSNIWKITQFPMDCSGKIKGNEASKLDLVYSSLAMTTVQLSSFFRLDDETNCPILNCKLKEQDCKSDFIDAKKLILIQTKAPWNIIIKQDQTSGFNKKVCVTCSTEKDEASSQLTVKQNHIECRKYISKKSDPPKNQILKYDAFGAEFLEVKQFFVNTEETICGFTKCKLLKKGCKQNLISDYASMSSNSKIQLMRSSFEGYKIIVCLQCYIQDEIVISHDKWKIEQLKMVTKDKLPVKCKIVVIGPLGDMKINFNQPMRVPSNITKQSRRMLFEYLTQFNDSNIQMQVEPNNDWPKEINQFNQTNLGFKWYVMSYVNDANNQGEMKVKLVFNSPGTVSPNVVQDGISVNMTIAVNQGLIVSQDGRRLYPEYQTQNKKIRMQMPDTKFNRAFLDSSEDAKDGGRYVLVLTMALNLFFSAAFGYMVQWINSIQMIIHLPMMQVIVPGNVSAYFQAILPILTFDIIDERILTSVLNFNDEKQEELQVYILDQMKDLGYESHNSVLLLGSLGVFAIWYWLRVLFYTCAVVPFVVCRKKGLKFAIKMKKRLFFTDFITITLEGYFEYIIAAYLNIRKPLKILSGEILGNIISYYSAFLCLFLFPLVWVILLFQPQKKLSSKKFKDKYGQFFAHMKPGKKIYMMYYIIFSIRRLIFCALAFYAIEIAFFQIQVLMYLNLFNLIYIGGVKPFETIFKNRIEMFNELTICIVTIQMCLFTDFVGDRDDQFQAGWQMVGVMILNMMVNFFIVFKIGLKGMVLIILKYTRLLCKKYKRCCKSNYDIVKKNSKIKYNNLKNKISDLSTRLDEYRSKTAEYLEPIPKKRVQISQYPNKSVPSKKLSKLEKQFEEEKKMTFFINNRRKSKLVIKQEEENVFDENIHDKGGDFKNQIQNPNFKHFEHKRTNQEQIIQNIQYKNQKFKYVYDQSQIDRTMLELLNLETQNSSSSKKNKIHMPQQQSQEDNLNFLFKKQPTIHQILKKTMEIERQEKRLQVVKEKTELELELTNLDTSAHQTSVQESVTKSELAQIMGNQGYRKQYFAKIKKQKQERQSIVFKDSNSSFVPQGRSQIQKNKSDEKDLRKKFQQTRDEFKNLKR